MSASDNDPRAGSLREEDVDADPFRQFERWFSEARAAGIELAEAAALATSTRDGRPSVRMVLVKETGEDGFGFYTGYESRKGRELAGNGHAALLFYWHVLGRQVRVEGEVERVSEEESRGYFESRPRESRLAAWASEQSTVIGSRDELEERFREADARFADDVPLPERWGGFRLRPDTIELWQHGVHRLHDRLRYRREGDGWILERLAP
jgi:pyridoxamine 5'-phosphate oxidase